MQASRQQWPADKRLHKRDLMALSWMCEQYAARLDHLEILTGAGLRWTNTIVQRLRTAELVTRERIVVNQPAWVIPTREGLTLCGRGYTVWEPKLGALAHVSAVNDVRLHIHAQKPESEWISERQLLAQIRGYKDGIHRHVPDGVLLLDGHRVAIEVELTIKTMHRVEAILDNLAGRFDGIPVLLHEADASASGEAGAIGALALAGRARPAAADGAGVAVKPPARSHGQRLRQYEVEYEGPFHAGGDAAVLSAQAQGEQGLVLATRVSGERALPVTGRLAVLSLERLCRHVLVCGATGSGKTETLLRLAWTLAKRSEAPVFYLDGKGDRENAERFVGLMNDAGRQTRVFPHEPFDGWRGEPHEIRSRLMAMVDYARHGPAAWYRDVAKKVVGLACEHPEGPPGSSAELLGRLDLAALRRAHGEKRMLVGLESSQVDQVRLRYEAVFGETRGALDGRWAWEDASAAYVLLDSLKLSEEVANVARFLFEDFAQYFCGRKPRRRYCMMIVDEFSALASTSGMAARVEQARNFNTSLILAPQAVAGMGGEEEAARILGSVETVVCHAMKTPDEIVALAGTRQMTECNMRFSRAGPTGEGTTMRRERPKIDPNKILALPPGEAFVISRGKAMHAQILRAPAASAPLPEPPSAPPTEAAHPEATGEAERKDTPVASTSWYLSAIS